MTGLFSPLRRRRATAAIRRSESRSIRPFLPYAALVGPTGATTRRGDVLRAWRVSGLPFETRSEDEDQAYADALATLWLGVAQTGIAIYGHTVRRAAAFDEPPDAFDRPFAATLDDAWRGELAARGSMRTDHYLTLVHSPASARSALARVRTADALEAQRRAFALLDEIGGRIEASMVDYGLGALDNRPRKEGGTSSALAAFLNGLASWDWRERVIVGRSALDAQIGEARILRGDDTLMLTAADGEERFVKGVGVEDFASSVAGGTLDALYAADVEFVATHSFRFDSIARGTSRLEWKIRQSTTAGKGDPNEVATIKDEIRALEHRAVAPGEYHVSLAVVGRSVEDAGACRSRVVAAMQDQGFVVKPPVGVLENLWFAQLPGNFWMRPRTAILNSRQFGALCPFRGFDRTRPDQHAWGRCVATFETPSGLPFHYSYHITDPVPSGAPSPLALGNALWIGRSRTGKTSDMSFMTAMARRYAVDAPMTSVTFDYERAARPCIAALGGYYLGFAAGEPTGANPLQLPPTRANLLFLERWIAVLARREESGPITTEDERRVRAALESLVTFPVEERRLYRLLENMTEGSGNREGSLVRRLGRWCARDAEGREGALAWVFDHGLPDRIDFAPGGIYGIDGSSFLSNRDMRAPLTMYLLHAMEAAADGRRMHVTFDEISEWFADDGFRAFEDYIGQGQVRRAKLNIVATYAAQMPSQILGSRYARALVEQTETAVLFANPNAKAKEYRELLDLNDTEIATIKQMPPERREFLVRQRFETGTRTVIAQLDLSGIGGALSVLSGGRRENARYDALLDQHGPDGWLAPFIAEHGGAPRAVPRQRSEVRHYRGEEN